MTSESRAPQPPAAKFGGSIKADSLSWLFLEAARFCAVRMEADKAGAFEPLGSGESIRVIVTAASAKPGEAQSEESVIPAAGTMAAYALGTANVCVSPDLESDRRFDDRFLRDLGVQSALMLPVSVQDNPVGVLGVFRSEPQEFTLDEVWYLERIADSLSQLVETAGWQSNPAAAAIATTDDRLEVLQRIQDQITAAEANERQLEAALSTPPSRADFRVSPRHDYPYCQKIAPIHGDQMPTWDKFVEVQCGDLSGGGLSLWLSNKPDFREIVVALGRAPSVTHFSARVVHVRKTTRAGRTMYQVGCQFIGRVYL